MTFWNFWAAPLFVLFAWPASVSYTAYLYYDEGYVQGYADGQEQALMAPAALETCTKWWFDGSEARAKQAINQYCDRRKK